MLQHQPLVWLEKQKEKAKERKTCREMGGEWAWNAIGLHESLHQFGKRKAKEAISQLLLLFFCQTSGAWNAHQFGKRKAKAKAEAFSREWNDAREGLK